MATRELHTDTLRGLACILLVLFHTIGFGPSVGLKIDLDAPLGIFNQLLGYLRMPMFAILSGFVYALRPYKGDLPEFVSSKVRRLLVPMFIVGTAFALMQVATPGANTRDYDWSLLHIKPVAHFWFLESLFLIFLLVAFLETAGLLGTARKFAAVLAVVVLAYFFLPLPVYFGLSGAKYLLPYFLIGVFARRFPAHVPAAKWLLLAFVLGWIPAVHALQHGHPLPGKISLTSLLVGVSFCLIGLQLQPRVRWLAWVGAYSYAIYLFHPIFSAMSRIALQAMGVHALALLILGGVVAGVLFPVAVEKFLRRLGPLGLLILGEKKARRKQPQGVLAAQQK